MSGWLIYWITRLDAIRGEGLFIITVFCGIGALAWVVFRVLEVVLEPKKSCGYADMSKETATAFRRTLGGTVVPVFIAMILLLTFLPTTKEAAAIYLIPKIANNEQVQKVPEQALRLLNAKLEEWIDDQIGAEPDTGQDDD